MSLLDIARDEVLDADGALFDPNRSDLWGASLSTVLPPALWIIALGLANEAGWVVPSPHAATLLPLWLVPFAWPLLLASLGLSRWFAFKAGIEGRKISWWLIALISGALIYPFASLMLDPFQAVWLDILYLFFTVATAMRLWQVSKRAYIAMLPGLGLVGLLALPSVTALFSIWSPGFAVTMAGGSQLPASGD